MTRITLIVTTYERPDALAACLRSVLRQSRRPDEVVVADDGSGEATRKVAEEMGKALPLRHEWLPHDGFRAGRMRNLGLARASGDYVVFADDDMLLHRDFVADHEAAAKPGYFVQGSRALLDETATRTAIERDAYWPGLFSPGVRKRKNLLHSRFLSGIFSGETESLRGIRTCNFGLWRADAIKVNGFFEDFVGWGREDSEFAARLMNSGVRRRNLKFAALGCHLEHPPRARDRVEANDDILNETIREKLTRRERGLNLHLKDQD